MHQLVGVKALEGIDAVLIADRFEVGAALQKHIGHIAYLPDGIGEKLPVAAVAAAAVHQLSAGLLHLAVQLRQVAGGSPLHQLLQLLRLLGGRQGLHHPVLFAGGKCGRRRFAARQHIVGKLAERLGEAVNHMAHFLFAALAEDEAHDDGENHHRIADFDSPIHGGSSFFGGRDRMPPPSFYLLPEGPRPAGESPVLMKKLAKGKNICYTVAEITVDETKVEKLPPLIRQNRPLFASERLIFHNF